MDRTAVVHLICKANGLDAFRAFIDSYRRHEAGAEHDLVLLCKGFGSPVDFREYGHFLEGIAHTRLFVPDTGYDIGSYGRALQETEHERYCFLNSFSVIQADRWLAMMLACLSRPRVGLVGATGSYESTLENLRREIRSLRGFLRRRRFRAMIRLFKLRWEYPPFPNPTLRTNAFMARGGLLRELCPRQVKTKEDALYFESGHRSLTRQVLARGLDVLVVGRDGRGYSPGEWPASGTFRQGDQANLLVADNQTARYGEASSEERQWLARLAWGDTLPPTDPQRPHVSGPNGR
jgi:hypothetical protein